MVDFTEIPLELQLKEANCCIQEHQRKGQKYAQFLLPMFLRWFPTIMDNQISVEWDSITGVFDRSPAFPITFIDAEILDEWHSHPSVWEVERNLQHSRCVMAMVHHMLVVSQKSSPVVVYRASFVYIPAHQVKNQLD